MCGKIEQGIIEDECAAQDGYYWSRYHVKKSFLTHWISIFLKYKTLTIIDQLLQLEGCFRLSKP